MKEEQENKDPYVVCLVPTRGDRPKMLNRCIEMMSSQTILPREVILMNNPPIDPSRKDITWRYRRGIERSIERHPNVELILFIEDDDWYSPSYIEVFHKAWTSAGRPEIFGVGETYYYNISTRMFYHETHPERASAFCTGVVPSASSIKWPSDDYSFIDVEIWKQLRGSTFTVNPPISLGIKGHKEGKFFGGIGHNDYWKGYKNPDRDLKWLKTFMDKESMDFYFKTIVGPTGMNDDLGPTKKGA